MNKDSNRFAIGDEFDFLGEASRVVKIEHNQLIGTVVTLVSVPSPGSGVSKPMTITAALLANIVDAYVDVMILPVDPSTDLEIAA